MDDLWRGRPDQNPGFERGLQVVRRRGRLGLLVLAAILAPGAVFVVSLPDTYEATATVLVERSRAAGSPAGAGPGDELGSRFDAFDETILGRSRLDDLAQRFDLYPAIRGRLSPEDLARRMRRDIRIQLKGTEGSEGRNGAVAFTVGYVARAPETAASVANALAGLYVDEDREARRRQASETAASLQSEVEAVRARLEAQEARIRAYNQSHAGELPQQMDANLARLQRLNTQLQLNSERQIRAMDRDAAPSARAGDAASGQEPEGAGDPDAEMSRLVRQLNLLRQSDSDSHPDVVAVLARIAALKRQQAAAAGGDAGAAAGAAQPGEAPTQGEMRRLRDEEQRLRATIAELERRVESSPQRQQELAELSRDYQTTKDLYGSLLKRREEAQIATETGSGAAAAQFRVLDPALPPRDPAAPNRKVLAVLLVAGAAVVALLAMALVEQLDTSFHSAESLRRFTRVPIVASIPHLATRRRDWRRAVRAGALALLYAVTVAVMSGGSWFAARDLDAVAASMGHARP